eukprot:6201326-Pleurochrysis_carterae.AAC.1
MRTRSASAGSAAAARVGAAAEARTAAAVARGEVRQMLLGAGKRTTCICVGCATRAGRARRRGTSCRQTSLGPACGCPARGPPRPWSAPLAAPARAK